MIVRSSLGTFGTRIAMSIAEFLGIFYLATAAGASVLGVYSLFIAVVRVVDLLTDAGLSVAVKKRISEGTEQDEFFTAGIVSRLAIFVVIALAILVFRRQVVTYIGYEMALPFLLVASFAFLVQRTLDSGLNGEKKVARAGLLSFVFSTGRLLAWVALLTLGYGVFGVLFGVWVGQLLTIVTGILLLSIRLKRPARRHFESLFRFAKYGWMGAVKETSWIWTDTLVLGIFVAPALVGVYELSWQITGVLFFVASAISSTLFANISELSTRNEHEQITDLLERSLVYTGLMAIPGFVGGIIFAEPILAIFGEEYRIGAVVVVVLILARVFHSYEVVFGQVINALDRPDLMFRTNTVFIVLNVVLNFVAIAAVGWIGAAFATTTAMVIRTVMSYHYIRSILDFTVPKKEIALEVLAAVVMGVCLWTITPGGLPSLSIPTVVLLIGAGAVIYAIAVLALIERIRVETFRLVLSNVRTLI
jgi:O-antigen/teichoic acid export membrane protein